MSEADIRVSDHELLIRIDERLRGIAKEVETMTKDHISRAEFEPYKIGFVHRNEILKLSEDITEAKRANDETQKRIRGLIWIVVAAVVVEVVLKLIK